MADTIKDVISRKNKTDEDIKWLIELYAEVKDSLKRLTPRRQDLQDEIETALDVKLFEQILRHNVLDAYDIYPIVDFVFQRLLQLCAPSQDTRIKSVHDQIREETEIGIIISMFLSNTHEFITEIEHLQHEFLSGTNDASSSNP